MIGITLIALTIVVFLGLSIPLLIFEYFLGKRNPKARDYQSKKIISAVFRFMLWFSGVKVTVKGLENIPKDQAVLFVGNHRSYFDILVGYTTVPEPVGFVAKKEMLRYPLLQDWMKNIHCLFLDRVNMKEGLKTILKGIEEVKNGMSIWIFPEGTRNRNESIYDMLPFKEGSLKIAEKSGCLVVPVAQTGTANVFEKHMPWVRSAHVTITFGTPINLKELPPEQKKFSGAYTQQVILGMLKEEIGDQDSTLY